MPTEISPGRIRRLATWYVDRGEAERQETDTIRQAELSEEFRKVLADEGGPGIHRGGIRARDGRSVCELMMRHSHQPQPPITENRMSLLPKIRFCAKTHPPPKSLDAPHQADIESQHHASFFRCR